MVDRSGFFKRTWLPRCRVARQPSRSRILISYAPDRTGWRSLTPGIGSLRRTTPRPDRPTFLTKLLDVERQGFLCVRCRFFEIVTLGVQPG